MKKKRPSFYLDEKQINNLYKHVRKKMKRAERLKRVKNMEPLFFTVLAIVDVIFVVLCFMY